jgi:hypothetical protein
MKFNHSMGIRFLLLITLMASLTILSSSIQADTGNCGGVTTTLPFTDVQGNPFFCLIAEAYFSGLTVGTSATTYSPTQAVPREQMAAFLSRTLDQSLKRGSKRAALGQWWTKKSIHLEVGLSLNPQFIASDGTDLWVANTSSNTVTRVRASDFTPLGDYVSVPTPEGILIFGLGVYVTSFQTPGKLYYTELDSPPGSPMFEEASNLGSNPVGITCDGLSIWTANIGTGPGTGSVSRVTGGSPTTFTTGFNQPYGILFDGTNLWVTDIGDNTLKRVDTTSGVVLQTINLGAGAGPRKPVFDGTNLWVPCHGTNRVAVVRAVEGLRGTVLATLTGNGLSQPVDAAFDGERVLVTNYTSADNTVSLWKATDLSPLGSFSLWSVANKMPTGACSDGQNFWVTLSGQVFPGSGGLVRF